MQVYLNGELVHESNLWVNPFQYKGRESGMRSFEEKCKARENYVNTRVGWLKNRLKPLSVGHNKFQIVLIAQSKMNKEDFEIDEIELHNHLKKVI